MLSEIKGLPLLNNDSVLTTVLSGYNQTMGAIKKIINAPTVPVSLFLYHCLPAKTSLVKKTREEFENSTYPYKYYIDLFEAMKVMKSRKVQRLLTRLYQPDKNDTNSSSAIILEFIELTGVARGIPAQKNEFIYNKLVNCLKRGGALKNGSEDACLPFIPRDTVLLNFFSSFIAPQFITPTIINEGVKSLVISGISLLSPALAGAIRYVDLYNPVKFLFPEGDTAEYSRRLQRKAKMEYSLEQQARRSNKQNFPSASHDGPSDAASHSASSRGATADAPLLGIITGTTLAQRTHGNTAAVAGLGVMLLAGSYTAYRYLPSLINVDNGENTDIDFAESNIQHEVAYGQTPHSLSLTNSITINSTCYNTTARIRELLDSDQTNFRLIDEFYNYIFNNHSDLNLDHARKLVSKFNITNFSHHDRDEMNAFLIYIFSALITPPDRENVVNLKKMVMATIGRVNYIWRKSVEKNENITINEALKRLRVYIYKDLFSILGTVDLAKLKGLENFFLTLGAPDFIQFENHGLGNENVISKKSHFYWTFMGKEYPENEFIRYEDFDNALEKGEQLAYYMIRFRNYRDIFESTFAKENFDNYTRMVNPDFVVYHEKDVQLERLDFITYDDIIEDQYRALGVNIYKKIEPNSYGLFIHLSPERHKELPYLQKCRTLRDVIRSFEDGPKVLQQFAPHLVPDSLRRFISDDISSFTLRPHPLRSELKKLYEQISQERDKEHISLYEFVVKMAFDIINEKEKKFIYHPDTHISIIINENKRIQYTKIIVLPKSFRFDTNVADKAFYNRRPYCEKGVFFSAVNKVTQEKRYYSLNIEASRVRMQLPITRLAINNMSEMVILEDHILDGHYAFHDGILFWDPCDKEKEFSTTLSLNPGKLKSYFTERVDYASAKWCTFTRHPRYIIASFTEKGLGPATTAIQLLQQTAVDNRKAFLSWQKERINKASETESEQDENKGLLRLFIEKLPTFSCFELLDDIVIKHEDSVFTPRTENLIQSGICAADILIPVSVFNTAKTLGQSVKKLLIQKLKKKHQLTQLERRIQLSHSLPQSSHQRYPKEIEQSITLLEQDLINLDINIKATKEKISTSILQLAGTPSTIEYPIFNIRDGETALSTIFFWLLAQSKKKLKEIQTEMKILRFRPWQVPQGQGLNEIENYALPLPSKEDIPCHFNHSQSFNATANIFDIHLSDPKLYQDLFFSALRSFDVWDIITTAKDGGWNIVHNFDQMAMFCFRAFTVPVRVYVGRILELEDYYKLNSNSTQVNAEVFYSYFKENLNKNSPISHLILTSEQNLLINQAIRMINQTFKSNINAFESNYIFMLKYLLMSIKPGLMYKLMMGGKPKEITERFIQQDINYNLSRFTFYATRSSAQEKFHVEAINYLSEYIAEAIVRNPAAITLLSPDIKTFLRRCDEYKQLHSEEVMPTPAEFIKTEFQIEGKIKSIYEKYARIEYSSRVLAGYPIAQWGNIDAQEEWLETIQEYLSPEMRLQDLKPFLFDVTLKVSADWQTELRNAPSASKPKIVNGDDVNPDFIAIVKAAFIHCSAKHQRLLFCQYYEADDGSWFTFLTNDFISETHRRSRRQVYSEHPFYILPFVAGQELMAEITSSLQSMPLQQKTNEKILYRDSLNRIAQSFIDFSSFPFHERLYGDLLKAPVIRIVSPNDIALMINKIMDDDGKLHDYQVKVLLRYFPSETIVDTDRILQLLSDIFQQAYPTAPNLYNHALNQLQIMVNHPWITLAHLQDENFIEQQYNDLVSSYQILQPQINGRMLRAITRYFKAAIHNLLDFSSALTGIDHGLKGMILSDAPAQQLCFGAIIAHQLQIKVPSHGDLIKLYITAMQDAGFIPIAALHQMALFSLYGRDYVDDALYYLASSMKYAAQAQQHLTSCVSNSQKLATLIRSFNYSTATDEQHQQLLTLALINLEHLHKLLSFVMPEKKEREFRQALTRNELRFTWYVTGGRDVTVAGISFDILNQNDGLLFPFGLPLSAAAILRQTPVSLTNETLTRVCFGDDVNQSVPFNLTVMTPASRAYPVNETVITTMTNEMQSKLRDQLNQLRIARGATDFDTQKGLTEMWLIRYLPFYAAGVGFAELLQSERIIRLAATPNVNQWKLFNHTKPENMSAVDYVEKVVSNVMGSFTDLPVAAIALRTRNEINKSISSNELPLSGFRGVWWDPMSYVCYLGFSNTDGRSLYASLVDNREKIYFIADNYVHARIWKLLHLRAELQISLSALQREEMSALTFFDSIVPQTWNQSMNDTREQWRLLPEEAASQLITQGVMNPVSYLQREHGQVASSVKSTPHVLQYRNGNLVFVFSEDNYQKICYRFVDSQGQLQTFPDGMTIFPHQIQSSEQESFESLFNTRVKNFIIQEQEKAIPEFLPLLNETEQQQIRKSLLAGKTWRREYIQSLNNITADIPFRFNINPDGLLELSIDLRRKGRNLMTELQTRTQSNIELTHDSWNVLSWRDKDLYNPQVCNKTIQELEGKKDLFNALADLLNNDPQLTIFRNHHLYTWAMDSLSLLSRSIGAIKWFQSRPIKNLASGDRLPELHQNCLMLNNFFSYYHEQPYVTPEIFMDTWEYQIFNHWFDFQAWQRALNQLRSLAVAMPDDKLTINNLMKLPVEAWGTAKLQEHVKHIYINFNNTLSYWRQPFDVEQLLSIRPLKSAILIPLSGIRHNRQCTLTLSANVGELASKGKSPPLALTPEQSEDLLLMNPGLTSNITSEVRLAGINSDPHTIKEFATRAKHRLTGPIFLAELSGMGFLYRLQNRINYVIASESNKWNQKERSFYTSSNTTHFLKYTDYRSDEKQHHKDFFHELFCSDALVMRLIMSDPEMIFGLLCDNFITLHPDRGGENISIAWFLFKETFDAVTAGDDRRPPYLIGV